MTKSKKVTPLPAPVQTETRRERFLRIAEPRVQRALTAIRLLGNLSTANYEWSQSDLLKIQQAIVDQLTISMGRFERTKSKTVEFSLTPADDFERAE